MKCRTDIKGRKLWNDGDNAYNTRPPFIDINLYRDGEIYNTVRLDSDGDGVFRFPCLIIWKDKSVKYVYTTDEAEEPAGYTKTIQGYDVVNTLESITVSGVKIWDDGFNAEGYRPSEITLRLFQNGIEIAAVTVLSPADTEDRADFTFGEMPYADAAGVPYAYTVKEDGIENYDTTINGFNVSNTLNVPIVPFSFTKNCAQTGVPLSGAIFYLRKNGDFQSSAESDADGTVAFVIRGTGSFQMQETRPPEGYLQDVTVHEVEVSDSGTITIDGNPAEGYRLENEPLP